MALLGIPLLLVACQGAAANAPTAGPTAPTTASPSSTPNRTPSAEPNPTSSAEPGAYATRCSAKQLTVSWGGRVSEPTGQHTVALTISNGSASGCYLFGYPQIALIDRTGRALPLQYQNDGDQVVTSTPPGHVDLAPRGLAYVTVNKYRCDTADLMQASDLRLTPPGLTSSFSVSLADNVPMDYCGPDDPGSIVHVSPVAPTESATEAR